MRYIRIQIDGNRSYLVYQRGLITEYALINSSAHIPILHALQNLKSDISFERDKLQKQDKLANKPSQAILRLLKQKRLRFARVCQEEKRPVSGAKHVGVEIEFISSSSRNDISADLAAAGLHSYVELKSDGSVSGGGSDYCDGSCREECDCYYCGETHYCEDESDCNRRRRNYGDGEWEYRDNCTDCSDTEAIDGCDCGGVNEQGASICLGEHVVCGGHCTGHSCAGYDDHEFWDCSCECNCSGEGGHEIAVVAKSKDIQGVITRVCDVLAKHEANVNDTCGLHVHIDARRRDHARMFANLVKAQKLLYSMVPKSRYRNRYCAPNDSLDMENYTDRYHGVNPKSYKTHKTIEVRLHSGTVNAKKINHWITLLQAIAYAKSVKEVNSLSDLTDNVKLKPETINYIRERVAKFDNGFITMNEQLELAA